MMDQRSLLLKVMVCDGLSLNSAVRLQHPGSVAEEVRIQGSLGSQWKKNSKLSSALSPGIG